MKNNTIHAIILLLILTASVKADEFSAKFYQDSLKSNEQLVYIDKDRVYAYGKPRVYEPFARFGGDMYDFADRNFRTDNLWNIGVITASTLLLIAYDQQMLDAAKDLGEGMGLSGDNNLTTYLSLVDYPVFRGPTDLSSALYYIGDGWTHISIGAGFLTFGLLTDNNRAIQTASQLGEGMLTCGASTQILKHITGRESPFKSTADGGVWRPLPDQIKYHKNVPKYDAYPSGHLCTAMMTVTVIAENYPEYKFIWPLGWTMMGLLSYQMMNNGVHWASDYPLSIGMGYSFAKIAVEKGRRNISVSAERAAKTKSWQDKFSWQPQYNPDGSLGLFITYDVTNLK